MCSPHFFPHSSTHPKLVIVCIGTERSSQSENERMRRRIGERERQRDGTAHKQPNQTEPNQIEIQNNTFDIWYWWLQLQHANAIAIFNPWNFNSAYSNYGLMLIITCIHVIQNSYDFELAKNIGFVAIHINSEGIFVGKPPHTTSPHGTSTSVATPSIYTYIESTFYSICARGFSLIFPSQPNIHFNLQCIKSLYIQVVSFHFHYTN